MFVATDTARDAAQLARQMARGEVKAASVAWATGEEVATGALVSRVAALRALVSRLQARTVERLEAHAERAEARRVAGEPVASLSRRIGHRRTMEVLHQALGVSVRLVEQGAESIARIADAVAALPQALQAMADRRAAQARQAEQERAARQQEIAAGVSRFRDRYADRRRQEAEAARDDLARRAVATWEDLIRAHHAALPGIATDPGLKGTREQLIQFARALDRTPEVAHALRTRGPEFGMETRPNLARVLDGASAERAVVVLLDGVEERQRATLKAEAEQKAALEARMRPRSSPGMGW